MFLVGMGSWFFVGWLVDRYESHLSLSEYRNRTLVQNSAPILVGAPSGQILHVNPEARTLFGIPPDQTDLNLRDLWLTDHADRLDEILHIGVNQSLEMNDLDMVNLGGRQIPIDLRACAIDYENKVAVYFLFRDITESRRAQEEILEANRKLQELDQLKTDFINNVSHELRTPISTIQFAEASLKNILKDTPDKNIPKLLGFIRDDGKRLRDLIEQLLHSGLKSLGRPPFQFLIRGAKAGAPHQVGHQCYVFVRDIFQQSLSSNDNWRQCGQDSVGPDLCAHRPCLTSLFAW